MTPRPNLTRMVAWSRQFIGEVLEPGDLAVDLTAGTGRDTLHLYQCVGGNGSILAFDIQATALRQCADRLAAAGARVDFWPAPVTDGFLPAGVHLIHDCHSRLADYLHAVPRAVVANLGYLPGGAGDVVTGATSTLPALQQSLELLAPGGRLVVTTYVGHAGGATEATQVEALFRALSPRFWNVLHLQVANRPTSPFLLLAEKRAAAPAAASLPGIS